jgi:hypothetical protein
MPLLSADAWAEPWLDIEAILKSHEELGPYYL